MRTRIKICCIASAAEARSAAVAGADAIGVVGAMPSGPGVVDAATARAVMMATPPGVTPILLTSADDGFEIAEQAREVGASVVQIVRHVDGGTLQAVRRAARNIKIIQAVHVEGPGALDLARSYAGVADALLLDGGRPESETPEFGAAGRPHDWTLSGRIVAAVDKPVWLAGGLSQANVATAIATVGPFGIDLCTGVRTLGRLDVRKLSSFMGAVRMVGA